MIKNIVFRPRKCPDKLQTFRIFREEKLSRSNIKATILSDIFASEEWQLLDSGEINTGEAIDAIAANSSLKKEEIAHIFNLRTDLMFPLDQNVRILPELKKKGFRLYFLSNFPLDIFEEIKSGYYFFKYFDGGIISSEAKFTKPDRRIYEILPEKYSLVPEECLFIDDIEMNVISGEFRHERTFHKWVAGDCKRN